MYRILKFNMCLVIFILISMLQGFDYNAKDKRDPFVPLASKDGYYLSDSHAVKDIKDIRLEGIVWDNKKGSIAIINSEIITIGQSIGDFKLLDIEENSVVFDLDGESIRIELETNK